VNRKYTLTVKETNKNCKKDYKVIVIGEKTSLAKITDMIVSKIINLVFVVYAIAMILGMILVDPAWALLAGSFSFFFTICTYLRDKSIIKIGNLLIAATLCTEIFIGAYVLLIQYVSVADILKCVRFENIGNTLTYIGLFFSVITSNHQNKK